MHASLIMRCNLIDKLLIWQRKVSLRYSARVTVAGFRALCLGTGVKALAEWYESVVQKVSCYEA